VAVDVTKKKDSMKEAMDALQEALKTGDAAAKAQIQKALDKLKEAQ
jgi:hypothetical protein